MRAPPPPDKTADPAPGRLGGPYLLYFAAITAPRAAMFALLIVLTRLLPAAEYGLFVLVITTGEILDMGFSNWVRVFLLRTEAGAEAPRPHRIGRAFALSAATTLLAVVVAVAVAGSLDRARAGELALATAVYIGAFALLRLALTMLQLAARHAAFAITEGARAIGILAATGAAATLSGSSFLPASLALSLVTGAAAVAALAASLRGMERPTLPRDGYRAAFVFGLPLLMGTTLLYAIGWWDRYILNYYLGPASVAVYAAAYSLARQPVDLLIAALNSYAFPVLVRTHETEGSDRAGAIQGGVLAAALLLGGAVVCGLTLLAPQLAGVLFPADYRVDVAALMPWMALGALCLALKQFVFDNAFHLKIRYWLHLATMVPATVLGLALSVVLIRSHGVIGAGLAHAGGAGIAVIVSIAIASRIFPFPVPVRALVGIAVAGGCATAVAGAAIGYVGNPVVAIFLGTLVFSVVYWGALTPFGFSLRRLLTTPWAAFESDTGSDRTPAKMLSNRAT